ncbi:hypothetical protein BH11PLA1_BH11PLA1_03830 [soil metagenome]
MPDPTPPTPVPAPHDQHPPTLYIIDGYAQFFRAYHAIRTPMTSPVTKEPTNLTFGFLGMLLKLLRGEGRMGRPPDYLIVAIDKGGDKETFRSELYPEYKANRPPPPEDLPIQVQRCLRTLEALGVPIVGEPGFEADDLIATLVSRLARERPDLRIRIVSKDKDLKQLLRAPGAHILPPTPDDPRTDLTSNAPVEMYDVHTDELITAHSLFADTGLTPPQIVDMLALMGDNVDNVPGIEGVGPKTAAELVAAYGTAEAVIDAARAGKIKGKRGEKIAAAADLIPLSRRLVALRHDAPCAVELAAADSSTFGLAALLPILRELGFNRYQDETRALLASTDREVPAATAAASTSGASTAPSLLPPTHAPSARDSVAPAASAPRSPVSPSPVRPRASSASPQSSSTFPGLFDLVAADSAAAPQHTFPADLGAAGAATRGIYRCVLTPADLDELTAELAAAELFAFDTETTGLSPLRCKPCGLSFSTRPGTGWYVPVRSPTPERHLTEAAVFARLAPLLEDPARPKVGHNLKYDALVLRRAGVHVRGLGQSGFDTMVASYLIDASRSSHALDALALALLGHTNISIKELIGAGSSQRTFECVPIDIATTYAAEDADISLRLMHLMLPQLRAMGLMDLFRGVEMPLVDVLTALEWNGITVDAPELERQRTRLQSRIDVTRAAIDDAAREALGRTFNPDSPKQLAAVLFNKPESEEAGGPGLGIKPVKRTKTGNSTDVEVLETLAEDAAITTPIPRLIVDYRQLTKLVSTYLVALRDEINPETGRIHASFNQTVAATGRLSSSDPNLQNIPIRTDIGREIRRAFVAAPGNLLISADYSQIELRLLAHLSRDPNLIEAFRADQDIHTAVAAQINHVPLDQVTKSQRDGAKMVNFGIVYGITPFGLARRLGIPSAEAGAIIDGYKRRFAGITTFLQECIEQARRFGYVETMLKRRRPIPDIESTNPARRGFAERTAINSVVQGSAADLIKLAMVDLQQRIEAKSDPALRGVKMLLQIHDELVFEAPSAQVSAAREVIVMRMQHAMSISVPLKADSSVGRNWFDDQ